MSSTGNRPIYFFLPNTRNYISYREIIKEREFKEKIDRILANVSEIIKQQLAR